MAGEGSYPTCSARAIWGRTAANQSSDPIGHKKIVMPVHTQRICPDRSKAAA
jgi:hypothetical protein